MKPRVVLAGLTLSASALVGLLVHEGYTDRPVRPLPGDALTIGFGTTGGVRPDDRTTPTQALVRALSDVQKFEGALKTCVRVPLHQHEYDAFISLSYNIGAGAFCGSTLVRKLNAGDYLGACQEILRWDKFQGRPVRGLTLRRQAEHQKCLGNS